MVLAVDRIHAARIRRPAEAVIVSDSYPLGLARQGERVRIERFLGGCAMARRLCDMGLVVGSEVRIAHRQGGQLVVVRGETRLALGAGIAHKVLVSPIGAGDGERRER